MENITEALFISTLNNERASCFVQDLRTGTDLMRYKGGGSMQSHSLQMLEEHFVIAANSAKPLLHVWPINSQEPMSNVRYVVPGKVNALALTPDSAFLIAGIQETIYVWHLNSGRLLNTLSKHYQPITCIRFTDNGEHFATAGKDGAVLVWNLTRAVAPLGGADSEENAPFYNFNDHGLAVTDVHIGLGGIRAFMYTVSLDRCCKVYDLSDGTMLLSVVFPVALHSVIVNRMETSVYVGTSEGQILIFSMEKVPRMKEYHLEEEESQAFVGHTAGTPITCLALAVNGNQLISGGEDKQVCIWDVGSRQLVKSISQPGAITNLHVRLIGNAMFHPGPKVHKPFADNLKRMISPDDDDECIELLITEEYSKAPKFPEPNFDKSYDGIDDNADFKVVTLPDDYEDVVSETEADDAEKKSANDAEDSTDDDEEMPDADAARNSKSMLAELEKLRAENAQLKLEAKRLMDLKINSIAGNIQSAKTSKKNKRARKN
ncbi:WD repeat-containing protein 18 [Drosophila novamexicana]|uniref:WD repeat-containing protein 18 n=1 Tax=Drosophila novamexicana TaxID=47314 RepID=UPI0011E58B42|nr:WD repeat-containing protein 18 [Drosophila novamexicana]